MSIPSHILPVRVTGPKLAKRKTVAFDKSDTNTDAAKQEVIPEVNVSEKRQGEDRRKRNIKPLIDTRTGRDRRHDRNRNSIDIKA